MRIALIHYSSPPIIGGVESVMAQHALLMTNAGHQVTIFAGRGKPFHPNIAVRIIPQLDSRNSEVMEIKKQLDQGLYTADFDKQRDWLKKQLAICFKNFDIIIAHNIATLNKNLPLTAALYDMNQTPGFPHLILWHHDLSWSASRSHNDLHEGYPWDLLRDQWSWASHVVVSETRRNELSQLLKIPVEQIYVVPNGVNMESFLKIEKQTKQLIEELKLYEADPLVLLPARLTPRKNIEQALYIVSELQKIYSKTMLVITGPEGPHNPQNATYKQKLLTLRDDLHLQGIVHFLAEITNSYIPDSVITDFYRLSDLLLFPSFEEGFGIPLIEAAFSSLPVFCSDIPVLRELGKEDVTYFNVHDEPSAIAALIDQRLNQEATLRWSRRVKKIYTWDSIYQKIMEPLLKKVVL